MLKIGHFKGFFCCNNAYLPTFRVDQTHFTHTDMLVGSNAGGTLKAPAEGGATQDNPGVWVLIGPYIAAIVVVDKRFPGVTLVNLPTGHLLD